VSNITINNLTIKIEEKELVNISFDITSSTALIGESGSGKSLTLKALLNLLPSFMNLKKEINSDFELNYDSIGFIPQNPFTSLSSMTKIKNQFFCSQEKKEEVLKLVDLDISKNTKLKFLHCGDNLLTNLDVSKNIELESLNYHCNSISYVDTSKNKILNKKLNEIRSNPESLSVKGYL